MKFYFHKHAPVEQHVLFNRSITVVRTDLVPKPPLPPYLKMIELYEYIQYLKETVSPKCVGYYAVPESEWNRILPPMCQKFGMKSMIGFAKTKAPVPEFIDEIKEHVFWIKPNFYSVNYSICKKHVEELGGHMIPMGVNHPVVVKSIERFFANSPLPKADTYIIPTGSGVALSGIVWHLRDVCCRIVGVCSRPVKSVQKILQEHQSFTEQVALVRGTEPTQHKPPFPAHRFWECLAWDYVVNNLNLLPGKICFVNLGS